MSFKNIKSYFLFFIFLSTGILFFTYSMFLSNFDLIPGDKITTLYNSYILEHSFLWITGSTIHNSFWSAPFNYPNANSLAYNETLMGIAPIYWLIRIFFKNPFSAYQILFIMLCILNYSTFYYLLKKQLNFSSLASNVSSFIFAFSILRFFRSYEVSYLTQFYTILAIIFLFKVSKENKPIINQIYFLLFSTFLILQFYSSFTLGFFIIFTSIIAIILGLLPQNSRLVITNFFKNYYKHILFYLAITFTMLLPMAYHHSLTEEITTPIALLNGISDFYSWIRNVSFLDTIFYKNFTYFNYPHYPNSSCSIGVFTFIVGLFGLIKIAKYKGVMFSTSLFIFFLSFGTFALTCWKYLYFIIPFTEGLEGINRISFILLIIFSISIANVIKFLEENKIKNNIITKTLLFSIIILLTIEQFPRTKDINSQWITYSLSKKETIETIKDITKKIPTDCKILKMNFITTNEKFFGKNDLNIKKEIAKEYKNMLSLWASLDKKIYTIDKPSKIKNQKSKVVKDYCESMITIDYNKI